MNQPKEVLVETTLIPSTASILFQAPSSATVPALYMQKDIQKDMQKITKFCIELLLQGNRQKEL